MAIFRIDYLVPWVLGVSFKIIGGSWFQPLKESVATNHDPQQGWKNLESSNQLIVYILTIHRFLFDIRNSKHAATNLQFPIFWHVNFVQHRETPHTLAGLLACTRICDDADCCLRPSRQTSNTLKEISDRQVIVGSSNGKATD